MLYTLSRSPPPGKISENEAVKEENDGKLKNDGQEDVQLPTKFQKHRQEVSRNAHKI